VASCYPPVTEQAIGVIDGANQGFKTSKPYVAGTLFAYYNGQLQQKSCVTELGGKDFDFEIAPEVEDTLQVRYLALS
jgi:hypothetical protein